MEKTTKTDNEFIAEFMGWERYSNNSFKCPNIYPIENSTVCGWTTFTADQLEFSKRWDWLMPVVERIAEYRLAYPKQAAWVCDCKIVVYKHILYREVVNFIKWYNSQALESK